MRHVKFQLGAILAAEGGAFLERVTELALEGPFTLKIGGIGILCRQCIGLVMGEGREVVDVTRDTRHGTTAAESHTLAALGLQQGAQAFLGIGCAEHCHASRAIVIAVVK